ncbi:hypothetical protein ACI2KR_07990 [Pseudomonas luteola]
MQFLYMEREMDVLLTLLAVVWTIIAFFYYRWRFGVVQTRRRNEFMDSSIKKSVMGHYQELKEKRKALIVDEGYGVINRKPWDEEIQRFIELVVIPEMGRGYADLIKTHPANVRDFRIFAPRYIESLVKAESPNDPIDTIALKEQSGRHAKENRSGGSINTAVLAFIALGAGMLVHPHEAQAASGGFVPYEACNVLTSEEGFIPFESGWHDVFGDGEFSCATPMKELGSMGPGLSNNIALYGAGTHDVVTSIKLKLNVNQKKAATRDLKYMASLCEKMVQGLVSSASPIAQKINLGKEFTEKVDGYTFTLKKEQWPSGKGYEYNCELKSAREGV